MQRLKWCLFILSLATVLLLVATPTFLWYQMSTVIKDIERLNGVVNVGHIVADMPDRVSFNVVGCKPQLNDDNAPKMLHELRWLVLLRSLDVSNTAISDVSVARIGDELGGLERLNLARTQTTDASIESLVRMRRLEVLDITGTRLSNAGMDELRKRLPRATIIQDSVDIRRMIEELENTQKEIGGRVPLESR
jgi:hypothetical protein